MDCYDTCVVSIPYSGIPLRTCADSINEPNVMSVTKDAKSNIIVEIHPPPFNREQFLPIEQVLQVCPCMILSSAI